MDEPLKPCAKQKKPVAKNHILYEMSRMDKAVELRNRHVVVRDGSEGKFGGSGQRGIRFPCEVIKTSKN